MKKTNTCFSLFAIAVTAFVLLARAEAAAVDAKVYKGLTGAELQTLLQDLGYRADLETDSAGDPLIKTSMEGYRVNIYTYNCNAGSCNNIGFSMGLNLADGTTLEKANEFNKAYLFGHVYLGAGNDPWLKMTHNVAHGVTAENLEYVLDRYAQAMRTFTSHFDF